MYATEFASILNNVAKMQKGLNNGLDATDGVWLVYDPEREAIMTVGMTGHTLYWERAIVVKPECAPELHARLQADLALPGEERVFPCRIDRGVVEYLVAVFKSWKNRPIALESFARGEGGVKLTFEIVGVTDRVNVSAKGWEVAHSPCPGSMLYEEMVKHEGQWKKKYAPMNTGCAFSVPATGMKMCMELMSPKSKKVREEPVRVTLYGRLDEEQDTDDKGMKIGPVRKYITANHIEILDVAEERPERGVIFMVCRSLDERDRYCYD